MQSMNDLYQQYARTVYKFLMARIHDEDLAEELTQETFYQALRSIDRFDGSCRITTWLCAIAKNQLSEWRRKHPQQMELGQVPESELSGESAETDVLKSMERIELLRKLYLCPEPGREILYLRIFGNLSFKEIGEIMGRTENWARVNYYRVKEKLRKDMMKDE